MISSKNIPTRAEGELCLLASQAAENPWLRLVPASFGSGQAGGELWLPAAVNSAACAHVPDPAGTHTEIRYEVAGQGR